MALRTIILLLAICCMGLSCGSSQSVTVEGVAPSKLNEVLQPHMLSSGFFKIDCVLYYTKDNLPFACYRYGNNPDIVPLFTMYIAALANSTASKAELIDSQGKNPDAEILFSGIVGLVYEKFGGSHVSIK